MHMSELLNEIREKAEARAKVLQKDIQEARDIIASYEAELAPAHGHPQGQQPQGYTTHGNLRGCHRGSG